MIYTLQRTALDGNGSDTLAYSPDQIKAWLAQGEGETLEFKERLRDPSLLARLVSAFANASGGVILVGVGPHNQLVGADSQAVSRTFHGAIAQLIDPPKLDLEATQVEGRNIVTISVSKGDRPTISDGGVFRRRGAAIEPLSSQAIQQSLVRRGADPQDAEKTANAIYRLTDRIAALESQVAYGNSFRGQFKNYIFGGVIGALFGLLLGSLI